MERGLIKTSVGYIHYRAMGQGKPIILLHTSRQSSAMFPELMEVLGKRLRVFAIDCPSYGMSDHVSGQPSFSDYARWVIEVMDGLELKKASFMGEAGGAFLSVELANAYAKRVERIILVNCPFWPNKEVHRTEYPPIRSALRPSDSSGFPLTLTLEFVLENDPLHVPMHPTQSWMDRTNVAYIAAGRDRWQIPDAIEEYDLASNLERLQCPVLLMWGDHFHRFQFKDEFSRRIKNNQVLVIKDGRYNVAWEHPEEVGEAILRFMSDD
ncbi:alpha/beta fold hydrolase [Chloroflexota bacterium]